MIGAADAGVGSLIGTLATLFPPTASIVIIPRTFGTHDSISNLRLGQICDLPGSRVYAPVDHFVTAKCDLRKFTVRKTQMAGKDRNPYRE